MCEYWIYSCNHTAAHTCRAHDPSGDRPKIPVDFVTNLPAPHAQTPNIGYGFGTGFYPGQTGVGENLPPPPPAPGFDPTKPLTDVQVYTKKKAAKHTELLTMRATTAACRGIPDAPRRSDNPCFQCLLNEGKKRRAGLSQDVQGNPSESTDHDNGRNVNNNSEVRERPAPHIIRESLNDNGAHIVGGKVGRRVKIFSGNGVRRT